MLFAQAGLASHPGLVGEAGLVEAPQPSGCQAPQLGLVQAGVVVEACQPWLVVEAPQCGLVEAQEMVVAQAELVEAGLVQVGGLVVVLQPCWPHLVPNYHAIGAGL